MNPADLHLACLEVNINLIRVTLKLFQNKNPVKFRSSSL